MERDYRMKFFIDGGEDLTSIPPLPPMFTKRNAPDTLFNRMEHTNGSHNFDFQLSRSRHAVGNDSSIYTPSAIFPAHAKSVLGTSCGIVPISQKHPKLEKGDDHERFENRKSATKPTLPLFACSDPPLAPSASTSHLQLLDLVEEKPLRCLSTFTNSPIRSTVHGEAARRRRKLIADKLRALDQVMPWNKRLDTATMLEEACKYVKFLKAQYEALSWMPVESNTALRPSVIDIGIAGWNSALENASRQMVLQVMMRSNSILEQLYSRGWCVLSAEQVELLRMIHMQMALRNQPMKF